MLKKYFIHIPGNVYSLEFYGKNKAEAIQEYKSWAKVDRMPRGYSIWLAS